MREILLKKGMVFAIVCLFMLTGMSSVHAGSVINKIDEASIEKSEIINVKVNEYFQKNNSEIVTFQPCKLSSKESHEDTAESFQDSDPYQIKRYLEDANRIDYNERLTGVLEISNVHPMASFEWTPPKPKVNEIVTFNASYSQSPEGTIVDYSWDWDGDDIYDESFIIPTVKHSWLQSGNYPVTLKITDNQGNFDSVTRTVFVVDEWDTVVPYEYPTIQDAIDNSNRGDRVFVRTGTYNEDIVIDVEMLILHGENKDDTLIIGSGNYNVISISDNAYNVNISGFTVSGSHEGLSGIFMESDYNIIFDNNIINNDGVGVETSDSSGNQIQDNNINNNLWGVAIFRDSHGVSLKGNTINRNSGHGIFIAETSTGNTVHNNTISDNGDCGISIMDSSKGNIVTWNTVEYNNIGVRCDGISDGNLYHHNSFIENNLNAFDGSINRWNSVVSAGYYDQLLQGNYWSDYDGVDKDGDGIGDTPYLVPGGPNRDNYPLMTTSSPNMYDIAGLYMFFSTLEWDSNKSGEITELVEGDKVYFTTMWDVIPDHSATEWEYYNIEYDYWLDGKLFERFNWEHQLDPYEWKPDEMYALAFIEWQQFRWNATAGNHTFRAVFDPTNVINETNEGNNEIVVDFYVAEAEDMVARFNWRPEQPEVNELVIFDASCSYTPNGEIIKYEWDWDDDGLFDESHSYPTVEHIWSKSGFYNITLNVIDDNGQNDSIKRTILVVNKRVIFVPEDYNTIQEAINNADDGITIHVETGTYNENIIVDKTLRIMGEGSDTTIINGQDENSHVICIKADGVEISGFTIRDCSIAFSGIRVYGNNSILHNNVITNCGGGIELYWTTGNVIYNNEIFENTWGVYIDGSSGCWVNLNHIELNEYGIETGISDVLIYGNTIENNSKHGIFQMECLKMIIHSNNILNNEGTAIKFFSSKFFLIQKNSISGNNFDGISIHKSTEGIIYNNSINNNKNYPISFWYYSNGNIIEENDIESEYPWGIHFESSENNTIHSNDFTYMDTIDENDFGLCLVRSSNNNQIYHNNFFNNYRNHDECVNIWDNGLLFGGNFWKDYSGIDNNNDGFGDIPNNIVGGGSQDHYPLIYQWDPPEKPNTPTGSINGKIRKEYSYQTSTTDPKGDRIQYGWDWDGDKNIDEWTGFYNSGETITVYHSWNKKGTYDILVVARDEHGHISDWSEILQSAMAKNKAINPFLLFLERLIERFPILEQILQPVYDKLTDL